MQAPLSTAGPAALQARGPPPSRLPFLPVCHFPPADLRWFEVDQRDVVEAKRGLLRQLAAEVPPGVGEDSEPSTPTGARTSSGLARHLSIDKTRFPLRCGSWASVPADLGDPAWADALLAAGFDPSKPTVWVAEGACV